MSEANADAVVNQTEVITNTGESKKPGVGKISITWQQWLLIVLIAGAGISAELNLIVVNGIDTPALTVSPFPQIIIPKNMAYYMDDKEIYFALCHDVLYNKYN